MAEQTITLPNANYFDGDRGWRFDSASPQVDSDLTPSGATRYLRRITLQSDGQLRVNLDDQPTGNVGNNFDLTSAFETSGGFDIEFDGTTYSFNLGGADTSDPYIWTPSNIADVTALYNALGSATDRTATLTIRDFVPVAPSFDDSTGDSFTGTVGTAITDITVPAANGTPAPTYAVVGSLPSGLNFNTTTRVLSGTPDNAGSGTITIRATNSQGTADWTVDYAFAAATVDYAVNAGEANWSFRAVEPDVTHDAPMPPAFTDDTGDPILAALGDDIADVVVPEAGGNPLATYFVVGTLPTGVTFTPATRTLSFDGDAVEEGSGTITVRAANSLGNDEWTVAYEFVALGMNVNVTQPPPTVLTTGTVTLTAEAYGDLVSISQGGAETEYLWALKQMPDGTWRLLRRGGIDSANLRNPRGLGTRNGSLYTVDWWGEDIWRISGLDTDTAVEIGTESSGALGSPEGSAFLGDVFWAIDQSGDDLWSWADVDGSPNGGQQRGTVTITGDPRGMTVRNDLLVIITFSGSSWAVLQIDNPVTGASTSLASLTRPSGITGDPRAIQEFRGGLFVMTDDAELVEVTGIGGTPALVERADFEESGMGSHGPGGMTQFPMPASYAWTSDSGGTFGDAAALNTTWEPTGVTPDTDVSLTLTVTDQGGNTFSRSVSVRVESAAVDYEVNAGPANWLFNLPQPTITSGSSKTVNAGPANWAFNIRVPSIDHDEFHDISAQPANWSFRVDSPQTTAELHRNADAANWTFDVPEPTAASAKAVDAGSAEWVFQTLQPSVDHDEFHDISARPVDWTFEVAQPEITHVGVARSVNANGANWAFTVPIPSVDHDQFHDISAHAANWTFAVAQPNVNHEFTPVFADDTGTDFIGMIGVALADINVPEASGNPAPTYAAVGNLPAGVTFNTASPPANSAGVLEFDANAFVEGTGTITIRATNTHGSDDWTIGYTFQQAPAETTAQQVISTPTAEPDTYGRGEVIQVQITFDREVDVTGTPQLPFNLGQRPPGGPEYMDYASGTGTAQIVFEWVVSATDLDTNGIFLYAAPRTTRDEDHIQLNGGTIRNAGTTVDVDADLELPASGGTQGDHQVDGSLAFVDANSADWTFNIPQPSVTIGGQTSVTAGPANWDFAVQQPEVFVTHNRDAGAANWDFQVAQPATDHDIAHRVDAGAANFEFTVAQPSVQSGADSMVNAGGVSWVFDVAEPTTDHDIVHRVNANPANWLFEIEQPTITTGGTTGVNAGDVAWNFAVDQPTVTHLQAHAVNVEGANWVFDVPQPSRSVGWTRDAGGVEWSFDIPRVTAGTQPGAPTFLRTAELGQRHAVITFRAPSSDVPFLRHEYSLDMGPWISIQIGLPIVRFEIPNLSPGRRYGLRTRSVNEAGEGAIAELTFSTMPILAPSPPTFPQIVPADGAALLATWQPPVDNGGGEITGYEGFLCDDAGIGCGWENIGSDLRHTFKGLGIGHRYELRLRALNAGGRSDVSETAVGVPYRKVTRVIPAGSVLPVIDADRQSFIVRLAGEDCRVRLWWQPSDDAGDGSDMGGWWASIEIPTNTPFVQGRRMGLNCGLLDRLEWRLNGNIVMRSNGSDEPARDSFRLNSHELRWEPN